MRKKLCLLLILFLAVSLSSCKDTESPQPEVNTSASKGELYSLYQDDTLPDDLNFGLEKVSILYWSDVEMQEFTADNSDNTNSDIVNDAIYSRNIYVENRLHVSLQWIPQVGSATDHNYNKFTAAVQNDQLADLEYDMYATYSPGAGILASKGFNHDLLSVQYFNPDMPWWPSSLIDVCSIGGKLYYTSGDISTNTLHFMYGTYYNKDKINDMGATDPYKLVQSNEWTLDRMFEMSKNLYQDAGTGNPQDNGYGIVTHQIHFDAFFIASGMTMVTRDSEENWCLSSDFTSSKCYDLVVKAGTNLVASDDSFVGEGYQTIFVEQRSLFAVDRIYLAGLRLREVPFSYGVVPMPKYDSDQADYYTCVGHPFTLYCIASTLDTDRANRAGAVLECLASEAYRRTSPAVFEQTYKLRYSDSGEVSEMFDLIRAGIVFDVGRIQNVATGQPYQIFQSGVASVGSGWTVLNKANAEALSEKIRILVETLKTIP